ncbi:MAG: SLC13 family permease [Pseudomonadota bacterium]|nr:SLC13 family permease [Pseudomonadota bacterium]
MHSSGRLFSRIIAILSCIAGIALQFIPALEGVGPDLLPIAGVVIFAVGLWATAIVSEYFTAIIFLLLAVTLTGTDRAVVFSGFHSSAAWMIFGGLIIALAVRTTGLGARIAGIILSRIGKTYLSVLVGIVIVTGMTSFVIPSNTARVMIMLPIFLALADRLGFAAGSNGRVGIALAVGAGSIYPSFTILPSAVPNLVLVGAAENILGLELTYGQYILAQFPVITIVSVIALPLLLKFLFPDIARPNGEDIVSAPVGAPEIRLLIILAVALALWMSDFAHGVSPAWVSLAAAIICMTPRIGMLEPSVMVREINLAPWFFVSAIVGMGAVVANSGLGDLAGGWLLAQIPLAPGENFANLAALSAIGAVIGWFATIPGAPAIMTTFAGNIAEATGWPIATVVMSQVLGWAMTLFPYQLPPIVLVITLGGVRIGQAMKLLVAISVVAWLVMLPLQYFYWDLLGMFG